MASSHNNASPHPETPPLTTKPEEFYRSDSLKSNNQNHTPPSVSPTDSQAPIIPSWSMPINQDYQQMHQPDTIHQQEVVYPPPPTGFNFRASTFGAVNGEIGTTPTHTAAPVNGEVTGIAVSTPTEQWARYPIPPLSAGLKTSKTTAEEIRVAELEEEAQKESRADLAIKLKVRLAKVVLRTINCGCSLVVLALVASTFAIFNATRHLPQRNNLRPWAATTPTWPQICILVIASISLALSLFIMYSYWRGGHNRAERIALQATIFAGAVFIFTIAMWSAGIGIMQASRAGNGDLDLWGWSCKDNIRRKLFEDTINYTLVCRQQDWVVVCAIIEISVEFLAICVYLFAFYRLFYTKRRLRKSMGVRDEARNSLWLAKLKEQREAEESDPETNKNTTLNQMNSHYPYQQDPAFAPNIHQPNFSSPSPYTSDTQQPPAPYDPQSNEATYAAEEGAHKVPILQPAPARHNFKNSDASEAPLRPSSMKSGPPRPLRRFDSQQGQPGQQGQQGYQGEIPPTPRSVTFSYQPQSPGFPPPKSFGH